MPEYKVGETASGQRLDIFLAQAGISEIKTRGDAQRLVAAGYVKVAEQVRDKNYRVCAGDVIHVTMPDPALPQPQDIPLCILYEDADIIVINKPRGMVVHPAQGNEDGTLVNALLFHCGALAAGFDLLRPGIVHRIDRDTSGLLVAAKSDRALTKLIEQAAGHSMTRQYTAVVHGCPSPQAGTVSLPIGRDERDRRRFCVTERNSKPALTHYETLEVFGRFSYMRLRLETGRTHQIRVHMAALGCPVAGDMIYGPPGTPKLGGQCLHAGMLGFHHPVSDEAMCFEAPEPDVFLEFLEDLRGESNRGV